MSGAKTRCKFRGRRMRETEGGEERGVEGAEGGGRGWVGVSPPQLGWGLGRGCAAPHKFYKTHVKTTHFAQCSVEYSSLKLKKFTKLK